jgi:hypothetical protein
MTGRAIRRKKPRPLRPDWIERQVLREFLTEAAKTGVEPTDQQIAELTNSMAEVATGQLAQDLADRLIKSMPAMIQDRKAIRAGFETRLGQIWEPAFDLLEAMIESSIEFAIEFDRSERPAAAAESDLVFEAVMRLHARACRIAREILSLMRSGFAMGSMSRVRALQENVVVALFIRDHGRDTAERYLLHDRATQWRAAVEYNTHAEALHEVPFTESEISEMRATRDAVIARFNEPCFDRDYGWALYAMGRGCSRAAHASGDRVSHRVTFAEIEKKIDLDQYRPYVRMASRAIHADSRALYWDLGLDDGTQTMLLYGPTNDGFTEPAAIAAHLVGLMTIGFILVRRPTAQRLMTAVAIMKLEDPMNAALDVAERKLDALKKEHPTAGGMFSPPPKSHLRAKVRPRPGQVTGR